MDTKGHKGMRVFLCGPSCPSWLVIFSGRSSIVILQPQMGDQFLAAQMSQRVLQLHQLNKQIMLRVESRRSHRRFEIKTQPLLNAKPTQFCAALRQVHEQNQVKHNGRSQNRIPAKKIHLDLHGVAEPAEDIDVVPALFVVAPGWVIVYADFVSEIAVKVRVEFGLQNVFENREL